MTSEKTGTTLPRRDFLRNATATAAALTILPGGSYGKSRKISANDRVNLAVVGVGGMGRANLQALSSQNIVALCDVDWGFADSRFADIPNQITQAQQRMQDASATADQKSRAADSIKNWQLLQPQLTKAARFTDYREMLAKQKNIDGVVVATPDHMHALIALAAMDLGKHVYVQKPLAWSVEECRRLSQKATSSKLQTQMGNQGHSSDDARLVNEYIQSGAIGTVSEVHVWTNRPLVYWPQGIPRPAPGTDTKNLPWNMDGVMKRAAASFGSYPVPDKLAWDLFLGCSRQVGYHPIYHPFNWRGWTDWGVGAIGDMGAHLIDSSFWSLDLDMPTTVETTSTPYNHDTYPMASTTYYEFPAKGSRPAVKLTWYDGGLTPPKPEEIGAEELNKGGGVLYIGSKGKLMHDTYGFNPRLLPKSLHDAVGKPPQTYERIKTSHEMNWVDAIRGTQKTTSPFEYSARLTEIMLLGVVALNAGKKIEYDGAAMKVTNVPDSDALLKRKYRAGWELA